MYKAALEDDSGWKNFAIAMSAFQGIGSIYIEDALYSYHVIDTNTFPDTH